MQSYFEFLNQFNCNIFAVGSAVFFSCSIGLRKILDSRLPTGHDIDPNNPHGFDRVREFVFDLTTGLCLVLGVLLAISAIYCFY